MRSLTGNPPLRCALAATALLLGVSFFTGFRPAWAQQAKPAANDAGTKQYAAAAALQNKELYDQAIEEWKVFLDKFPDHPKAARGRHYLGVCLYETQQYGPALEVFQKLTADQPKFELLESTLLFTGLSQFGLGQGGQTEAYDQAAATFAKLIESYPMGTNVHTALYHLGESLYARDKKAEAAGAYARLVKEHPKSELLPDALYALAVTQQQLGQNQEAAETCAKFLAQFKDHTLAVEVGMRRGQALLALGQFAEAEPLFAAAVAAPNFVHADFSLLQQAACLSARKEYAKAAALYASLPEKFAQSQHIPAAQLEGGKCAYLAGDFAAARAQLSKVVAAGGEPVGEAAHWIAKSFLKENQPAEGLKVVEQALPQAANGPFAAQLAFDQADCLYEIPARRGESVPLYAAVAAKYSKDPLAPQALYMAGFAALGQNDFQGALQHADAFLKAFAGSPLEPDVLFVAAESRLQLGQFAEAEPIYTQLAEKYPQLPEAEQWKVRRGLALYRQKKFAETVAALEPVLPSLKAPAVLAEAQYLMGASHIELKQFEPAVKSFEAALAADANWRQADETLLGLALAYKSLNKVDQAKATLASLVQKFPESPTLDRAHYRLGECAYAAADYKGAAAEYQVVLDKWPTSTLAPYASHGLGWSQLNLADYAAAVATLTGLIDKYPESTLVPRARYARALARQPLKEFSPAIEDLEAYLKTDPTGVEKSDARYVLGLCQAGLDKPADAAATFEAILAEDPDYAGADKARYELAWALKAQNQDDAAATAFGDLAEKHPDSPLVAESLYHVGEFRYQHASELLKGDQRDPALAEFKQAAISYHAALTKAGKTDLGEEAAHKLGWAQFRMDDFAKAQEAFAYQRAAWPQGPLAADAAFMEGECLFKQQKFAEALAAYAQVANPSDQQFAALSLLHGGQAAGQLKQWDQSLALLDRCVKEHPDWDQLPECLYEQGWAHQNLGKPDEALPLYEAVTTKTDREVAAQARFMIGEIYFEKKNHAEAVRNFIKAAYGYGYPHWQAEAQFEAGRCFEVLGKKKQAIDSYRDVVEKHPDSDKVPLAQARLKELGG